MAMAAVPSSTEGEERFTTLSKKLCYLLRHGLRVFEAKGCAVYGPGEGWVRLDDLLQRIAPLFLRRYSQEEIETCLRTSHSTLDDAKPRFEVKEWKRERPPPLFVPGRGDAPHRPRQGTDGSAATSATEGNEENMEMEEGEGGGQDEGRVWLVRATYAHTFPLHKIQRRLPVGWDMDDEVR